MLSQAISAAKENKFEEYGYVVLVSCLAVLRPALDRYTSLRTAMSMDVSQFLNPGRESRVTVSNPGPANVFLQSSFF